MTDDRLLRTALLVDDDPQVRCTLAMMLEDLGFDVKEAKTPHEALEALEAGAQFDVLVTDVVMPEMDGWTFAETVRASRPTIPIVYVSGFSSEETRPVSGSRVLRKPFSERSFTTVLSDLLLG